MRKYLLVAFIIAAVTNASYGQLNFGVDVGMSSSKAPMVALKCYFLEKNAVSIGFSYKVFNDALGKSQANVLPNTFAIGDGTYFYSIDLGYTRIINDNFSIEGEVSFGQKTHFQNWSDDNFSEGGYHRTLSQKTQVGAGVLLFYNFNEKFGIFGGYNSTRQAAVGVSFKFFGNVAY